MLADHFHDELETVECFFSLPAAAQSAGADLLCWGKIVWVDRSSAPIGQDRKLAGQWIARKWTRGADCPWVHNKLYQIPLGDGLGFARVKVGEFRQNRPI